MLVQTRDKSAFARACARLDELRLRITKCQKKFQQPHSKWPPTSLFIHFLWTITEREEKSKFIPRRCHRLGKVVCYSRASEPHSWLPRIHDYTRRYIAHVQCSDTSHSSCMADAVCSNLNLQLPPCLSFGTARMTYAPKRWRRKEQQVSILE